MKKLNMGKVALTLSLVSVLSVSSVFTALADWEQQTDGKWKYKNDDGNYATSCLVDGYYVNGDGIWLEDIKSDSGTNGSWKNVKVVKQIGYEISQANNWTTDATKIYSNSATYGNESSAIELSKTDDGYEFNIYTKLSGSSEKGFRALCYLISDDDTLFQILYDACETDNNHGINTDSYTTINSYSIKATVTDGCVSFFIKTV